MEKVPGILRSFSKEQSQMERDDLARTIRRERADFFDARETRAQERSEQSKITEQLAIQRSNIVEKVADLETKLQSIEASSWFPQLLHRAKKEELRGEISTQVEAEEAIAEKLRPLESALEESSGEPLPLQCSPEWHTARRRLAKFYAKLLVKWESAEYSPEEMATQFSEERLVKLSVEEYILLLKRFPQETVTHVTRQGIRDHVGHMNHNAGVGAYTDGFRRLVEDGRLRSPLGVYLMEEDKEAAVALYLGLESCNSKNDVESQLDKLTNSQLISESGGYPDKNAVHFAVEEVADIYYGSERGNEIFLVYPSAQIASQYYYNGQLTEAGGGYWNDLWVWTNDEKGLSVDAALVFIPKDAKVDAVSGSQYILDSQRNPIVNTDLAAACEVFVRSEHFAELINGAACEILGKFAGQRWYNEDLEPNNQKLRNQLEPFKKRLEDFGITDSTTQRVILNYNNLLSWNFALDSEKYNGNFVLKHETVIGVTEQALSAEKLLYHFADNTISSQEYWERQFDLNNLRPSKVIYYEGNDPTAALKKWKCDNGLNKPSSDPALGFPNQHIRRTDDPATLGYERFRSLAVEIAAKYIEAHGLDTLDSGSTQGSSMS